MNLFKALFGSKEENPEEKKKNEEARNFDVLKYDGVKALQMRQMSQAVLCFNAALQMKEDLEVRDYLSQALIGMGELSAAFEQLQKLSEAEPDNIQILIRMANVAYMMEDYNIMSTTCEKILLLDTDNATALYLYGRACIGMEDHTNALGMLTKAIQQDENFGEARLLRAETLLKIHSTEDAETDAKWLYERAPENEDVLLLWARLEQAKGDDEQAILYYNKVIEVNPFCVNAFKERAELRLNKGDRKGYEEDMAHLMEISPEQNEEDVEEKTRQAYRNVSPFGI